MPDYNSNYEKMCCSIRKSWGAKDSQAAQMVELGVFTGGLDFLNHGTMTLPTVFEFLNAGLIIIEETSVGLDEFPVIELLPQFARACQTFSKLNRKASEQGVDYYAMPNGYDDRDEEDLDWGDFRNSDVFMMSEARLLKELKTGKRDWLYYRTPYRVWEDD